MKDEENSSETKCNPFLRQLVVCFISWSFYFMFGLSMGAPTVIVPQLRQQANSTDAVSPAMASWITSILGYSGIAWVFILTISAHYIGRKKSWIIASLNSFVAFVILYYSTNAMQIFIAQFLLGFTGGTQTTISTMILTECSSPKYRGLFLTFKSATFFWGLWTANAIGTFFHFKYIGLLGIICSIYNLATIKFIPESPYWLASKGRYDECAKAHHWLKGYSNDSENELEVLIQSQKEIDTTTKAKPTLRYYFKTYIIIISQPEFYKPVALCLLVQTMYYASGKLVFAVYAIEIMKNITQSQSTAYTAMLILDGFSVFSMYIGCFLVRICRRRTLLFGSSSVATTFIFIMSLYLFLVKQNIVLENHIITVGLLILFSISICCGPMILSQTITGELYPIKARGFTICFVAMMVKLILGTSLKVSPMLFVAFDIYGTFLFYGILSLVCLILAYKYVPETKDKTLQDIAALFGQKIKIDNATELKLLPKP